MARTPAYLLCVTLALVLVSSIGEVVSQQCGCQPRPDNGHVTYYKDRVEFGCGTGFRLSGPRMMRCSDQGDTTQPRCLVDACERLDEVSNGTTGYVDSAPTPGRNIKAQHSCDEGFCLVGGTATQTCLATGVWSGALPRCAPKRVIRVSVVTQETIQVPTVRVQKRPCSGWNLVGCNRYVTEFSPLVRTVIKFEERTVDCSLNAMASAVDVCGSLDEVSNGTTDYVDSPLTPGRDIKAQHSCDKGFCLVGGTATQTCLATGVWSGTLPSCVPQRVIRVSVVRQETIQVPIVRKQTQPCFSWNLVGCRTKSITEYVPRLTTVIKFEERTVDCALNVMASAVDVCGRLEVSNGTTGYVDSLLTPGRNIKAQHSCDEGFCLVGGPATQTCLATGVWSGILPRCVPKRVIRVSFVTQETIQAPTVRVPKPACGGWNQAGCLPSASTTGSTPQTRTVIKFKDQMLSCALLSIPLP